ncbi:MAG: F0F1 ATP synthase subunit B [Anaerolineales bacterium]|nr:F0F1 ATP synthase subunit B [Anaerolineales bacterium]MBX3005235.1 F0F1 ATP synthase subunit B [Anaerolineales bacterium]MCW5839145.1 F0F1 ATP synthase subunit B [Anaerolineales bacterium]
MEALGINLGFLLVQIFNFLLLLVLLRKWVFTPIMNMLQKRRETISKGLEDASIAAEARENAEKEAEKLLSEARAKVASEAREITARAEEQAKEIVKDAEAKAGKAREVALAEVEQERVRVLGEVRGQVAALAAAAAQKLIGEALDDKRQHALINEFFSGVSAGKVTVLDGAEANGPAVVTSALPLTADEQGEVQKALGKGAEVTFKVDPNILGGLVVRIGDKVLDGSVSGQLGTLRQNLR